MENVGLAILAFAVISGCGLSVPETIYLSSRGEHTSIQYDKDYLAIGFSFLNRSENSIELSELTLVPDSDAVTNAGFVLSSGNHGSIQFEPETQLLQQVSVPPGHTVAAVIAFRPDCQNTQEIVPISASFKASVSSGQSKQIDVTVMGPSSDTWPLEPIENYCQRK